MLREIYPITNIMSRCKNGTRKDKSGNCVAHNKTVKRSRNQEQDKQLVIPKKDIYDKAMADAELGKRFAFASAKKTNKHHHFNMDNFVELKKNDLATLKKLAKLCEIKKYNKLKKSELLSKLDKCVVFEE
jgi:hypothetical protein